MLLLFFCCLFLLPSFGSLASNITVEKGKSTILFKNVNNTNSVKLYINGKQDHTLVVTWTVKNVSIEATWLHTVMNNYSRIFMDPERNIWIVHADKNYEGTYSIQDTSFNVTLIVLDKHDCAWEEETKILGCCIGSLVTGVLTVLGVVVHRIYLKIKRAKRAICSGSSNLVGKYIPCSQPPGSKGTSIEKNYHEDGHPSSEMTPELAASTIHGLDIR